MGSKLCVAEFSCVTITDEKLYFPVVTLSTEDNTKLSKLLSKRFKRPVYWNKYKVTPNREYDANQYIRERLDTSCQGVKILFVLAYGDARCANRVTVDSHRRYFLPIVKSENYNIEIDGRNFYDHQLMTWLSNTMKLKNYQQGKMMVIQLVVY